MTHSRGWRLEEFKAQGVGQMALPWEGLDHEDPATIADRDRAIAEMSTRVLHTRETVHNDLRGNLLRTRQQYESGHDLQLVPGTVKRSFRPKAGGGGKRYFRTRS